MLVKDLAWSRRLAKYAAMLPALQRGIPVPDAYKRERPGTDADLNAYDVVYVVGAGERRREDDRHQPAERRGGAAQEGRAPAPAQERRAREVRSHPRARSRSELIVADQLPRVTFDAFFENVMFHEVAHGLGIKNTIDGKGTVRDALKERYSALEEGRRTSSACT